MRFTIDPSNLSALFRAVERETEVILEGFYDADTLFEDLALRFARSRHLDAAQKNKYSDEIRRISKEIAVSTELPAEKHIPRAYSKIVGDLKEAIKSADTKKADSLTVELEERLGEGGSVNELISISSIVGRYLRFIREHPVSSTSFTIVTLVLYALFIMFFFKSMK